MYNTPNNMYNTSLKAFIILAVNTILAQNYYNENTKNSKSYSLLQLRFVFLKEAMIFRTSYSSKLSFEFFFFKQASISEQGGTLGVQGVKRTEAPKADASCSGLCLT